MKIQPVGASCIMRTDGQTGRRNDADNGFRNFANAPRSRVCVMNSRT
jgi:hypothetical protein